MTEEEIKREEEQVRGLGRKRGREKESETERLGGKVGKEKKWGKQWLSNEGEKEGEDR